VREIELAVLIKNKDFDGVFVKFPSNAKKRNLPTKRQNGLSFKMSGLFKCSTKHCNSRMHNGMKN
jgi:hypothetical protein